MSATAMHEMSIPRTTDLSPPLQGFRGGGGQEEVLSDESFGGYKTGVKKKQKKGEGKRQGIR